MAYLKGVSPKKKHRFSIKQCKERKENIIMLANPIKGT
jgi:hypothetical protein